MKTKKKLMFVPTVILAVLIILAISTFLLFSLADWGFARDIPFSEQLHRLVTVHAAQQWLGTQEGTDHHDKILQTYNSHRPLAQGYTVTADDSWCAAFGSCVAIQRHLTDIIPTECSCERQIGLWQTARRWEEQDCYQPLPGDYIYYDWDAIPNTGDSTGWSDHVGIVVGTFGPFIKVIEGNKDDQVAYRIILRGDYRIRGFGLPDYASKLP